MNSLTGAANPFYNANATYNYKTTYTSNYTGGVQFGGYIIVQDGRRINLTKLADMMDRIDEILLIVTAHMEQLEEYPALKSAYDEYKLIEAMVRSED